MSLPSLPLEILVKIALESPGTFRQMLALRPVVEFVRYNREWILSKFTRIVITKECTKYYLGDKLHREVLPAIEYANGSKIWYQAGKRHRSSDLPAAEWSNGAKTWYQDGVAVYSNYNGCAYIPGRLN